MKPKKIPAAGDPFAEVFENMPRQYTLTALRYTDTGVIVVCTPDELEAALFRYVRLELPVRTFVAARGDLYELAAEVTVRNLHTGQQVQVLRD